MARIPSRGVDQFMLRFPDGMRDRIKETADANGRSMNAEIIARLEASFGADSNISRDAIAITEAIVERAIRKVLEEKDQS